MKGVMVGTRGRMRLLAGWLAVVVLVAAACSDSGDDQVATLTDTKPPPPVEATQDAPPDPPPPAAEPPAAPEVTPAEAPAAPEPEPPPSAEPEPPPPLPEGELDAAAVAALVSTIDAAQSGVRSSREQVYLTVELNFGGQPAGSVSDVPFTLSTTVGGLTHVQMDLAALAALSGFGDGMAQPAPAGAPPLETVLDGSAQQLYVKLGPLAALGPGEVLRPGEQPPELESLAAQRGAELADLWGRVDLSGAGDGLLAGIGLGAHPSQAEFLALLQAASDSGSILEARADGSGQVGGVATQIYTFVVDLAKLTTDLPPFLEGFLGGPGAGGPPPDDLLGSLPVPLATEFTLHVGGDGLARQVGFDLDLGEIMMAVFAGFGEMGETPDGADIEFPEIEYRVAIRIETLAVNDPSLSVTLPDPSLVVELP